LLPQSSTFNFHFSLQFSFIISLFTLHFAHCSFFFSHSSALVS
jgi:hypothetical protein